MSVVFRPLLPTWKKGGQTCLAHWPSRFVAVCRLTTSLSTLPLMTTSMHEYSVPTVCIRSSVLRIDLLNTGSSGKDINNTACCLSLNTPESCLVTQQRWRNVSWERRTRPYQAV